MVIEALTNNHAGISQSVLRLCGNCSTTTQVPVCAWVSTSTIFPSRHHTMCYLPRRINTHDSSKSNWNYSKISRFGVNESWNIFLVTVNVFKNWSFICGSRVGFYIRIDKTFHNYHVNTVNDRDCAVCSRQLKCSVQKSRQTAYNAFSNLERNDEMARYWM